MDIYLIRHTTPAIEKGICYGQTDLDVTETFADEVLRTKAHIPAQAATVFSSPLQRCRKLAEALFPQHDISFHDHLMELDCGDWEMQPWDDIPKDEIDPWMKDFVHVAVPNGESYTQLHERVVQCFEQLQQQPCPLVIVAHGGVLRSILSHITGTPLKESFNVFTLHYGCVVRLSRNGSGFAYEILYNHSREGKEWHRPREMSDV
jgi:alpha-ribazole phosphatase